MIQLANIWVHTIPIIHFAPLIQITCATCNTFFQEKFQLKLWPDTIQSLQPATTFFFTKQVAWKIVAGDTGLTGAPSLIKVGLILQWPTLDVCPSHCVVGYKILKSALLLYQDVWRKFKESHQLVKNMSPVCCSSIFHDQIPQLLLPSCQYHIGQ